jgi:AAA family ATPase
MPTTFTIPTTHSASKERGSGKKAETNVTAKNSNSNVFTNSIVGGTTVDGCYAAPIVDRSDDNEASAERADSRNIETEIETGTAILEELVQITAGFSGAEVVAVVQEAAMLAVDRGHEAVDRAHLIEAIQAIKPQITPDMLAFYENLAAQY